ncbi:recombination protein RecR [Croceicoccus ponticola]|uniref:Recombination protein RecR n=1 Tax=Croceicoccus ponticola TaxID=2217664 RepID=A0A437H1B6_9SPHN|nr:zf-TFIIB domain-containing protein [Croceicoccus ponticola]RVQ69312.1 recombination protein RecR [Croceicoccus ponticola]
MRTEDQVAAMSCPVCRVPLAMSDRQGIEIDYCPQCRGVWLDRGELDKIIERSAPQSAAPTPPTPPSPPPAPSAPAYSPAQPGPWGNPGYDQGAGYGQGHGKGYGQPHYGQKGYKKRKSWLEEIFD